MASPAGTMWRISRLETKPQTADASFVDFVITLRDDLTRVTKTYPQRILASVVNTPGGIENIICSNLDPEFFPNDLTDCA